MANPEHERIVKRGGAVFRAWRERHRDVPLDLHDLVAPGVDLHGADLRNANFTDADLSLASLVGADLSNAILYRTDLSGADLRDARIRRSALDGVDLRGANLSGVDLADAAVSGAWFDSTDLQQANLGDVRHFGPSSIDALTLHVARGRLPEPFLRGCGLADWEIVSAKLYDPDITPDEIQDISHRAAVARLARPIQTRPVFVSYSHRDAAAVDAIEAQLQGVGIRVWRDIHDVVAGPLEMQVHRAMHDRVVLIVLSGAALDSDWVRAEVEHARGLEKAQNRHVLCPIALDDTWGKPRDPHWPERLMVQVKDYAVLDFSKWQEPAAFAEAIRKLEAGIRKWY